MIKGILQACLTSRHQAAGLYLEEPDDHTVVLFDVTGRRLAVWNSTKATVKEIQDEADKRLYSRS